MTAAGYAALAEELRRRQQEERPRIIQQISEARAHGDLSENAEYHAAKEAQSLNEGRIAELEDKLSRAEVIDVSKLSGSTIKFGATVTVVDEDTEEEKAYQIVGEVGSRREERPRLHHEPDRPGAHRQEGRRHGRGQDARRRQELRDPEGRLRVSRARSAALAVPPPRQRSASSRTAAPAMSAQTLGIAEALGAIPDVRRVAPARPLRAAGALRPSRPAATLAAFAPPLPRHRARRRTADHPGSATAETRLRRPDLHGLCQRAGHGPAKPPISSSRRCHDGLTGDNVVSPRHAAQSRHRRAPRQARAPRRIRALPPCPTRASPCSSAAPRGSLHDLDDIAATLSRWPASSASWRRPRGARRSARARAARALAAAGGFLWDGAGENPYFALLANADRILVTGDSVNMVGEAVRDRRAGACPRAARAAAQVQRTISQGSRRRAPSASGAVRLTTGAMRRSIRPPRSRGGSRRPTRPFGNAVAARAHNR